MIDFSDFVTLIYPIFLLICLRSKFFFWGGFLISQGRPLSKIPGPKWASYTRFWLVKTLASGQSIERFIDVNKQNGKRSFDRQPKTMLKLEAGALAHIRSNHLLSFDPEVIRNILSTGSRYRRVPWFGALRIQPHITNVVSERASRKRSRLRYILSAGVGIFARPSSRATRS